MAIKIHETQWRINQALDEDEGSFPTFNSMKIWFYEKSGFHNQVKAETEAQSNHALDDYAEEKKITGPCAKNKVLPQGT